MRKRTSVPGCISDVRREVIEPTQSLRMRCHSPATVRLASVRRTTEVRLMVVAFPDILKIW